MKIKDILIPASIAALFLIPGKKSPGTTTSAGAGDPSPTNSNLPRGIRNNNPGNLILTNIPWQGKIPNSQNTDGHFEQFNSFIYGTRAMMKDLITDINRGDNTILKLMYLYAPPHENPTESYIRGIETMSGVSRYKYISPLSNDFKKLVQSIANFENYGIKNLDYTIKSSVYEQAKALV
jgi:hypothetical protein